MGKYTDWKNEPSLTDFQEDYESALPFYYENLNKINRWTDAINGGTVPTKVEGKSTYRSKMIRKFNEWSYSTFEEPILSDDRLFKFTAENTESVDVADKHSKLLNYQWNHQLRKTHTTNSFVRHFVNKGTAIVKVGWEFEFKEITKEVEVQEIVTEIDEYGVEVQNINKEVRTIKDINIIKHQPELIVRDPASVIIDPHSNGDIKKAKFVIDINSISYTDLKKYEKRVIETIDIDGNKSKKEVGYYFNLDRLKELSGDEFAYDDKVHQKNKTISRYVSSDDSKKVFTMKQYWGYWDIEGNGIAECIVACWVDDVLIRLEKNPYPHNQIPYVSALFMPIEDDPYGEPNAELLSDDQDLVSSTTRGMLDISARGAIGQEFINQDIFTSPVQQENYRKGRTVFVRGDIDLNRAIHRRTPDDIPASLFNLLQMHTNEAEQLTGVTPYNISAQRGGYKSQSSSGGKHADDATTKRDMNILRRLIAMLEDMADMIATMNKEFILDDTTITVGSSFEVIGNDDLQGSFRPSIDIITPEVRDALSERIYKLMQTNASSMHPELADKHYKKLARLWGMNDLADEIDELSNREPSQAEQEMQRIQLENAQLENMRLKLELAKLGASIEEIDSKTAERKSRAEENKDADIVNKLAEAKLKAVHADKVEAQTRLIDQEYEYIVSGQKRYDEQLDKEFQHEANIERENVRTDRENKKLTVTQGGSTTSNSRLLDKMLNQSKVTDYDNTSYLFNNIKDNNSIDIPIDKQSSDKIEDIKSIIKKGE